MPAAPSSFHVALPGATAFEACRDLVVEQMRASYDGWDDEFDRRYDSATVFTFLSTDREQTPCATMKFVLRESLPDGTRFVCESADRGALNLPGVRVEGAGVSMRDRRAGLLMGPAAMRWAMSRGWGDVVTSFDVENQALRRLYLDVYRLRSMPAEPFTFDSFVSRATRRAVRWRPLLDRAADRIQRLRRAFPAIESQVDFGKSLLCREVPTGVLAS